MKRIAFGIVTVTALAWGVSVQAAPNGAAASEPLVNNAALNGPFHNEGSS